MKIDEDKLNKSIIRNKKLISMLVKTKNKNIIGELKELSKEICLVVASFKCQACSSKNKLQFHHLIQRRIKGFVEFFRYASQRHYWANCLILCNDCHSKCHGEKVSEKKGEECSLSESYIKEIKGKYIQK